MSHFRPFGVEHATIDNELVLDLDPPVLERGGGAIRKRLRVFELDRERAVPLSVDGVLRWEGLRASSNCSCS
jgi:hypothetical protein